LRERLYNLLDSAKAGQALVIGDVILDCYLAGTVERISPEAPAPILNVESESFKLGGAANVAANVKAMGWEPTLIGAVGDDRDAGEIHSLLKNEGIGPAMVVKDKTRPTIRKTRVIAMRQQMLRLDHEKKEALSPAAARKMLAHARARIKSCAGVIVSDYGKGALPPPLLAELFELCRKHGKVSVVDPKGKDYTRYRGAHIITPNKKEAEAASGVEINSEADYRAAADKLFKTTRAKSIVITRGPEGMSIFGKPGAKGLHLPAEALEVFDVTGAGDTVAATLGTMLFGGFSLEDAVRVANVAAAIEVGHAGVYAVSKKAVMERLEAEKPANGKLMNNKEAGLWAAGLRAQGKKVVFTNGCFDLLHAGHVRLLRKAATLGDRLIVGLNSDSSIRRLKGSGRPLLHENDRLEILGAIDCVHAIALFSESTPKKLIAAIRPDVLVKGSDYKVSDVVGRDTVEKYGGRVELVKLAPGRSTSNIIDAIIKRHKG